MSEPFRDDAGRSIHSISGLNQLAERERIAAYRTLVPDSILIQLGIDPQSLDNGDEALFNIKAAHGGSDVVLQLKRRVVDRDPLLYIHIADTASNQIIVLLYIINDPDAPRFDVDLNWKGERTQFGTLDRNIEAEIAAMQAGLAPGQVRRGLRLSRTLISEFERFVERLTHSMFFLEPLAYHTAVLFERYGCGYSQGQRKMDWIHQEFQTGGELFARLDDSTPFRMRGAEQTVRGRAWAIHDGILGEPFTDVHMYKRITVHSGICTFPDALW